MADWTKARADGERDMGDAGVDTAWDRMDNKIDAISTMVGKRMGPGALTTERTWEDREKDLSMPMGPVGTGLQRVCWSEGQHRVAAAKADYTGLSGQRGAGVGTDSRIAALTARKRQEEEALEYKQRSAAEREARLRNDSARAKEAAANAMVAARIKRTQELNEAATFKVQAPPSAEDLEEDSAEGAAPGDAAAGGGGGDDDWKHGMPPPPPPPAPVDDDEAELEELRETFCIGDPVEVKRSNGELAPGMIRSIEHVERVGGMAYVVALDGESATKHVAVEGARSRMRLTERAAAEKALARICAEAKRRKKAGESVHGGETEQRLADIEKMKKLAVVKAKKRAEKQKKKQAEDLLKRKQDEEEAERRRNAAWRQEEEQAYKRRKLQEKAARKERKKVEKAIARGDMDAEA